jgi:hypothetical protein
MRVELTHVFPVPVSEAFAYITDIKNWPEYWPDFVRLENQTTAKWADPGDEVTMVIMLLNRERSLHMRLGEFKSNERVAYTSQQPGLPDIYHERHFKTTPAGCEYRLAVEYEPRPGLTWLFDRFILNGSFKNALQKTVDNLDKFVPHKSEA